MTCDIKQSSRHVLQIHLTRKCNLKCLHCYSMSGPQESEALPLEDLKAAMTDAKHLGYGIISLSGGEPFLYPHLRQVLEHGKKIGLKTGLVTNGMFLDERRLSALKDSLDLVVISLDGAPERHNVMRANKLAFETMAKKLPNLKEIGIPFGFLYTLSQENAHELDWAADFAVQAGAELLQIHPLDSDVGRAAETQDLADLKPDDAVAISASRRAIKARNRVGNKLRIVVDYKPRMPQEAQCQTPLGDHEPTFADLVPSLCIETDGAFVPMGHGFSRDYLIGNLGEAPLATLAQIWIETGPVETYLDLVKQVQTNARHPDAPMLQNIAQVLSKASHKASRIAAE